MDKQRILLVDGHGIAFRAFYALPELTAADGTPTNAVVGFFNMLGRMVTNWKPYFIVVAFDMKGPTFRHELFDQYKATRSPTPEAFILQVPLIRSLLVHAGICVMERAGLEADDLLGSAAVQLSEGHDVLLLSSDKDILQVLRPGVTVLRPGRGVSEVSTVDALTFEKDYGFPPALMVDYLALVGDKVDNIPGIPGVGDKTARSLLSSYGSIEGVMAHADELKPAMQKKFLEFGEQAISTRKLTALKLDDRVDEFLDKTCRSDRKAFMELCTALSIQPRMATPFFPSYEHPTKITLKKKEPEKKRYSDEVEILTLYLEPDQAVSLEKMLESPRLAIDVEGGAENFTASLINADGLWWQGTLEELKGHSDKLTGLTLLCADMKELCRHFRLDTTKCWDLLTAHYLLHPDRSQHDIGFLTGLAFSPERTLRLFVLNQELNQQIEDHGMADLMKEVDMPLIPLLVEMEQQGVGLDQKAMEQVVQSLSCDLDDVAEKLRDAAGGSINLNSPKQVGDLLFTRLALPVIRKTKTGFSTDVSVLEELNSLVGDHCEVPSWLLTFRELSKMLTGFAQPLTAAAKNGVIHSTFEAHVTGTGRLSSRDPNLQNLPTGSHWGDKIRQCLVPSQKDSLFVAADYSQIELRVLAHLCDEPRLKQIFFDDRDIHTETAALVFNMAPEEVTKELRRMAKTVSFGLLYGMSSFGLASRLGTDRARASEIIDAYFHALPGVRDYVEKSVKEAASKGYTQTCFGRIRPLDEVETGRGGDRGHLRRVAINAPIQGTAADITKIAMIKVAQELRATDAQMVLQVHDSIVCQCPASQVDDVMKRLCHTMSQAVELSVPLKVDAKQGATLAHI